MEGVHIYLSTLTQGNTFEKEIQKLHNLQPTKHSRCWLTIPINKNRDEIIPEAIWDLDPIWSPWFFLWFNPKNKHYSCTISYQSQFFYVDAHHTTRCKRPWSTTRKVSRRNSSYIVGIVFGPHNQCLIQDIPYQIKDPHILWEMKIPRSHPQNGKTQP